MTTYTHTHTPTRPAHPGDALEEIRGIIEDQIVSQPRSLQKRIGPSEIGTPCDHCLAAKLAGWPKQEKGIPWATTVGTGVHLLLEHFFNQYEQQRDDPRARFLTEAPVMVGKIAGQEIWGSTDLVDTQTGLTVDWKIVGQNSLTKYRNGPNQTYRTQAHLYAKGWNDAGLPINHVSIYFLPRAGMNMSDGYYWIEKYDPNLATEALRRANILAARIQAYGANQGEERRDQFITSLPRDADCFDCRKYGDYKPRLAPYKGIDLNL